MTPETDYAPPPRTGTGRILVAEDEQVVALDLETTLTKLGYSVVGSVISGAEAVERALALRPDLILMDIRLDGEMDGIQAATEINKTFDCPVIYLTAYSDDQTLARAKQSSPFGYLVKPFKAPELHCTIEIALHRHEMDARLREQEKWLSTTLRSLGDAVVATDAAKKITFLNPVAEALTGWSQDEALGKAVEDILNLVDPKARSALEDPIRRVLRSGAPGLRDDDALLIARSGSPISIEDSTTPIRDEHGALLGGVTVLRDITEQRRNEEEIHRLHAEMERLIAERTAQLEVSNSKLGEALRVKREFLGTMSHELKTPLNAIIGLSDLFTANLLGDLTAEQRQYIQHIAQSGNHLLALINDILDLSNIEAGTMVLSLEPVEINSVLRESLVVAKAKEHIQNVNVHFNPCTAARPFFADRHKVRQIVCNLLSNALKFTPGGGEVRVSARAIKRRDTRLVAPERGTVRLFPLPASGFEEFLEITVWDNGIGIADLGQLFREFSPVDSGPSRSRDGAGIGLVLVQQLAELHGGAVAVASAPGEGSCFVVWLPWREQGDRPPASTGAGTGDQHEDAAVAGPSATGATSP